MRAFRISYTGVGRRDYAWSLGFGPLETEMPFLHPAARQRKDAFWKVNYRTFSGLLIDSTGAAWPDVLGSGGPPPSYFMSERIIDSFQRSGVTTSRITEMPIGKIKSKRLSKIAPPRYFVVEAYPGIAVAWDEMNVPTDGHGNPNLQPLPKPRK